MEPGVLFHAPRRRFSSVARKSKTQAIAMKAAPRPTSPRPSSRLLLRKYRKSLGVALLVTLVYLPFILGMGVGTAVALCCFSSFVFGTCFFLLFLVRRRVHLRNFGVNVVVQTALMVLTALVAASLTSWGAAAIVTRRSPFSAGLLRGSLAFVSPKLLALVVAGAGLISAFFAIDRKLGPGVMFRWVTGKYYNPTEETRIFMFLDLRGSTTLAERLGNVRFSALVRDFFADLTEPVLRTKGEVSHYIGDEAVISWTPERGLQDANCVRLFFLMREAVARRADYYRKRYGLVPEFKAGLHIGPVVATEVGEVKSEIVFHGDVVNTAARIQSLCGEEGCDLLLSADLAERLRLPDEYRARALGPRKLKGKASALEIAAIDAA
jgi:adenylate cyclase